MNEGPIQRIETAYADYFEERQAALKDAGVVVRDLPGAVLFAAKRRPDVDWMNTALFQERPTESLLEEVTAFYRNLGIKPRLETLMGEAGGFVAADELFVLVAMAGAEPAAPPDVKIRRVDKSTFARFADTYVKAFDQRDIRRTDVDAWQGLDNWRFHLAEIDGKPAGAAILTLHGDLAYLASAATLPSMRRRGVHAALLRARMLDAADAGCTLVFGRATPGGHGASGMTRAHMVLSHRKQIWQPIR
jgi:GNAT superfamily N-acetyltransferase